MTTNNDRSRRSSSGCHVAHSDMATGLSSCWGVAWLLGVALLAPSFHFRGDSGSGVTYLSVNDDERGCHSSSGCHIAHSDVATGGCLFIPWHGVVALFLSGTWCSRLVLAMLRVLWSLRVTGDNLRWWWALVTVRRWRHWVGIVDDGGCERVGFGVVDHAQIDRWQTPMIDLGMAGHCMCRGKGTGFHSVEFRELIPSG